MSSSGIYTHRHIHLHIHMNTQTHTTQRVFRVLRHRQNANLKCFTGAGGGHRWGAHPHFLVWGGHRWGVPPHFLVWGGAINQMQLGHFQPRAHGGRGWAPSYQALPKVSRPRYVKEEKQQLHAMPCGWGRQDSTRRHLWRKQEFRCQTAGHHYGEWEMEEREAERFEGWAER